MQLQGAAASAAAAAEEFSAVYLPLLIFLIVANSSSSAPSETKKRERKKYLLVSVCPRRGRHGGFWSGISLAPAATEMGCDSHELGTKVNYRGTDTSFPFPPSNCYSSCLEMPASADLPN